ncbi:hypothetical protein TRICHSKD4_3016 [Roseibium sp. TrichSKD4]|nr:hypothetical protein [Roseibium sp. TrichSKD4]EFO31921.1 hypothetical protein TRICHSKD4_3016 [Roseibium sp. TrichSKD4]
MSDESSAPNQFNFAVPDDTGHIGRTSGTTHQICMEKWVTK